MKNFERSKVKITSRDDKYSQWYLDVAKAGKMYENSPTPGCITFLPKSVKIWNGIKDSLSELFQMNGVQDLYLPLLIPMSFLEKEKEHVEGFAPECAVVTHGGGKKLEDPLVVRPTSETLFCDFFKNNLGSYKDLPLLYNQWVNVMRWEKRTRPFLRTAEFYWQEGHTLHETKDEANDFSLKILNEVYVKVIRDVLAIDGLIGEKSVSERFAGADHTYTFEGMMSNGWALQMGTSHMLGKGFVKQFDIQFTGRDGEMTYPSYTSWGVSTRLIGALISSHSDDKGLIIPPKLSEYKAVLAPIYSKDNKEQVDEYIRLIGKNIVGADNELPVSGQNIRAITSGTSKVMIDFRDVRLGNKINEFEVSGYPVMIQAGAKEIENGTCIVVSRISGEKLEVSMDEIESTVDKMLEEGQKILFQRSRERLINNTVPCESYDEIGDALKQGKFALYEWDQDPEFEKRIKDDFKATTRCMPFEGQFTDDLLTLKNPENKLVIVARNF